MRPTLRVIDTSCVIALDLLGLLPNLSWLFFMSAAQTPELIKVASGLRLGRHEPPFFDFGEPGFHRGQPVLEIGDFPFRTGNAPLVRFGEREERL